MAGRVHITRYRVRSILPGDGWEVVYRQDDGEEAVPLDFVGVADVHHEEFDRGRLVKPDPCPMSGIVGIIVADDGDNYVVNDMGNFVRLQRKGAGVNRKPEES